jgi:hypothetical protein
MIDVDEKRLVNIDEEITLFRDALKSLEARKEMAILQIGLDNIVKQVVENLTEDDAYASYQDVIAHKGPRERKTRVDVLTCREASLACKSNKNHKLKPKTPIRDKTKTPKSKALSKNKMYSSNKKEAAWDF